MSCSHVIVEPVEMIATDANGRRYRDGSAYSCPDCKGIWRYVEPEDLPHWLYEKLKAAASLPMPALTPAIMESLKRDASSGG